MSRLLRLSGAVLLLCAGSSELLWAGVCRAPDETAERIRLRLARYALANHPDDKAVRDSLRLPQSAQISIITSESVCKKANAAYQAVLAGTGHGFSGQVYVIQVGTTYAVFDPVYHWGPDPGYLRIVIFDSRWRRLSSFTT
jgi:hypothetical protein